MKTLSTPTFVSEHEVFWGEIAPTEHVLHLYSGEDSFLRMLEGFVAWGLVANEGVIVSATAAHLALLNQRLEKQGFNLRSARKSDQYLDLDAEACLARFMRDGWPDEERFMGFVGELIERARGKGRRVRAFGEMVALLWDQDRRAATVRLEYLWNALRETAPFPLFCSYPKAGFTADARESLRQICAAHTKVISNPLGIAVESVG